MPAMRIIHSDNSFALFDFLSPLIDCAVNDIVEHPLVISNELVELLKRVLKEVKRCILLNVIHLKQGFMHTT
jgi:hypothetical protein